MWTWKFAQLASLLMLLDAPILRLQAAPLQTHNPVSSARAPAFERDILPILKINCVRCHNAGIKKGGLDLSTTEGIFAGASSGPVVVPTQPDGSKLYDVIHSGTMPLDRKTHVSPAEM